MVAYRLTLHLDQSRSMENLLILLDVLGRTSAATFPTSTAIVAHVREQYDISGGDETVSLARLLGLLDSAGDGLRLSPRGAVINAWRPQSRADALHFLLWSAWRDGADAGLGVSWSYRAFCAHLWALGTVELTGTEKRNLVADLLSAAQTAHADLIKPAALSVKSINGMRRWLAALDPPVLDRDTFRRRDICSSDLVMLALGYVARTDGVDLGADLLLSPERRQALCRICLLEPTALDRALDRALPAFAALVEPGTRTGAYGRFLRIKAFPTIEAIGAGR